jgi:hypothetical protein
MQRTRSEERAPADVQVRASSRPRTTSTSSTTARRASEVGSAGNTTSSTPAPNPLRLESSPVSNQDHASADAKQDVRPSGVRRRVTLRSPPPPRRDASPEPPVKNDEDDGTPADDDDDPGDSDPPDPNSKTGQSAWKRGQEMVA